MEIFAIITIITILLQIIDKCLQGKRNIVKWNHSKVSKEQKEKEWKTHETANPWGCRERERERVIFLENKENVFLFNSLTHTSNFSKIEKGSKAFINNAHNKQYLKKLLENSSWEKYCLLFLCFNFVN